MQIGWSRDSSPHAELEVSPLWSPQGGAQGVPCRIPAPLPASRRSWMEGPAVGRQGWRNKEAIATGTLSDGEQSPAAPRKRRGREIRFVPLAGSAGEGTGKGPRRQRRHRAGAAGRDRWPRAGKKDRNEAPRTQDPLCSDVTEVEEWLRERSRHSCLNSFPPGDQSPPF